MNFINKPIKNLPKEERKEEEKINDRSDPESDSIVGSSESNAEELQSLESHQSIDPSLEKRKGNRNVFALDALILVQVLLLLLVSIGSCYYLFLQTGISEGLEPLKAENQLVADDQITDDKEIFPFFEGEITQSERQKIEASSFIAFNPTTYQIYTSSNIDTKKSIASITKLMSAITSLKLYEKTDLLQAKDLSDTRLEWLLGLEEGDLISYEDLIKAMLINSYNDAAYVVAQNHPEGQPAFIDQMNNMASMLGMEDTKFENPAGLDHPDNYSTAQDIKRLALLAIKTPEIMEVVKLRSDVVTIYRPISIAADENESATTSLTETESIDTSPKYPSERGFITKDQLDLSSYEEIKVTLKTTNELLDKREGMLGLKTGYTSDAGPSFVGYFFGSEEDQLITIILDANGDRFEETDDLIELIRSNF